MGSVVQYRKQRSRVICENISLPNGLIAHTTPIAAIEYCSRAHVTSSTDLAETTRCWADCNQHRCFWSCCVFAMTVYVVRSPYSFAEQTQCLKFGIIYRRILNETFPLSCLLIFTSMEQNHWTWHNDQCWSWILWYPLFFKKGDMFAETEGVFA